MRVPVPRRTRRGTVRRRPGNRALSCVRAGPGHHSQGTRRAAGAGDRPRVAGRGGVAVWSLGSPRAAPRGRARRTARREWSWPAAEVVQVAPSQRFLAAAFAAIERGARRVASPVELDVWTGNLCVGTFLSVGVFCRHGCVGFRHNRSGRGTARAFPAKWKIAPGDRYVYLIHSTDRTISSLVRAKEITDNEQVIVDSGAENES